MRVPQLIQLPKFLDERGNLSFLENENQLPFVIQRVHWIYDVPGGEQRGGVAYKETEEFVIALSGSFDVVIHDGKEKHVLSLNRSYKGVYIPKGTWRTIENFSTNSVALICASTKYDAGDDIRDFAAFRSWRELEDNQKNIKKNEGLSDTCSIPNSIDHQSANEQDSLQPDAQSCSIDSVAQTLSDNLSQKISKNTENFNSIYDCTIIHLDRHHSDRKGDICVVENGETLPFDVKRVYYLYDVPGGVERGGHAHKALYQLIIAASGSFTVTLDDGRAKRSFTLNRPYQGLLVKPGIWRNLNDFSSGTVCMVLASEKYDAEDYIRDYSEYQRYRQID